VNVNSLASGSACARAVAGLTESTLRIGVKIGAVEGADTLRAVDIAGAAGTAASGVAAITIDTVATVAFATGEAGLSVALLGHAGRAGAVVGADTIGIVRTGSKTGAGSADIGRTGFGTAVGTDAGPIAVVGEWMRGAGAGFRVAGFTCAPVLALAHTTADPVEATGARQWRRTLVLGIGTTGGRFAEPAAATGIAERAFAVGVGVIGAIGAMPFTPCQVAGLADAGAGGITADSVGAEGRGALIVATARIAQVLLGDTCAPGAIVVKEAVAIGGAGGSAAEAGIVAHIGVTGGCTAVDATPGTIAQVRGKLEPADAVLRGAFGGCVPKLAWPGPIAGTIQTTGRRTEGGTIVDRVIAIGHQGTTGVNTTAWIAGWAIVFRVTARRVGRAGSLRTGHGAGLAIPCAATVTAVPVDAEGGLALVVCRADLAIGLLVHATASETIGVTATIGLTRAPRGTGGAQAIAPVRTTGCHAWIDADPTSVAEVRLGQVRVDAHLLGAHGAGGPFGALTRTIATPVKATGSGYGLLTIVLGVVARQDVLTCTSAVADGTGTAVIFRVGIGQVGGADTFASCHATGPTIPRAGTIAAVTINAETGLAFLAGPAGFPEDLLGHATGPLAEIATATVAVSSAGALATITTTGIGAATRAVGATAYVGSRTQGSGTLHGYGP
jgi:hypothetical protein